MAEKKVEDSTKKPSASPLLGDGGARKAATSLQTRKQRLQDMEKEAGSYKSGGMIGNKCVSDSSIPKTKSLKEVPPAQVPKKPGYSHGGVITNKKIG